MAQLTQARARLPAAFRRPGTGSFIMAMTILILGFYLIYPIVIILIMSFNTVEDVLIGSPVWGLDNWLEAWDNPLVFRSAVQLFPHMVSRRRHQLPCSDLHLPGTGQERASPSATASSSGSGSPTCSRSSPPPSGGYSSPTPTSGCSTLH